MLAIQPSPAAAPAAASGSSLPPEAAAAVVERLVGRHGAGERARIAGGVGRVAAHWTEADGDAGAFEDFCARHYCADPIERDRLLARLEAAIEALDGHLFEIRRHLRRGADLRGDALPAADALLATFNPAPDLTDQLYRQGIAFLALLNFERPDLATMLAEGADWSLDRWAETRITRRFGPRVPAAVDRQIREAHFAADAFVSGFHVPVGNLVDAEGQAWFEPERKLVAHWLIREQLRAGYARPDGLPLQRALAWVMRRTIDGSLPAALMAGTAEGTWDPQANTLAGRPVAEDEALGPERYARWLAVFGAAQALDAFHPEHPSALARRFGLEREIPEAEVERILTDLLEAPVRRDLATLMRRCLGRPLEAHDIYFEEVLPARPVEDLDARVTERYPDAAAFERDLPALLRRLGFAAEDADFFGTRIRVEIARGAGHAMPPGTAASEAWLRTNSLADCLGWDGFEIGMHELGHNLEQLASLHRVPRPALRGVPNAACTEAFAFLYQSLAPQVIVLEPPPDAIDPFDLEAIRGMLAACQIAGPGLVELQAWRWLYAHPEADPAALRDAVLRIAGEVWERHYARDFGPDPYAILAAYQHMVAYPLYLPDYALGQLIAHQVRAHMRGADLAAETLRICSIGRLTPALWMQRAVGAPIGPEALIRDAAAALSRMAPLPTPA